MRWLLSAVFLLLSVIYISAQDVKITGIVVDSKENPIPYANIVVTIDTTGGAGLTYTISEVDGRFTTMIPDDLDSIYINFTALGFKNKTTKHLVNENVLLRVILSESTSELKQVLVTAQKKIGDTLSIAIDSMGLTDNDNLGEILEKTEGIILGEDGSISYRGKQIRKIMINGKEVFVNQNKTALDNLTYEMMKSVQVIDNHKGKFEVNFDRIRSPVINIGTKENFTGVVKGELTGGGGYNERYSMAGKGLFFSDGVNFFLDADLNNFGALSLSDRDVMTPFEDNSTSKLNDLINPFLEVREQAKRNVIGGSSVTARLEGEVSKSGLVLNQGYLDTEIIRNHNATLRDSLFYKSSTNLMQAGYFLTGTINHARKLGEATLAENVTDVLYANRKEAIQSQDSLFIPRVTGFLERTSKQPSSFSFKNTTNISRLINDRLLIKFRLSGYHETTHENLLSSLQDISTNELKQRLDLTKSRLSLEGGLQRNYNISTLGLNLGLQSSTENAQASFLNESYQSDSILRNISTVTGGAVYQGGIGKFSYYLSVKPNIIYANNLPLRFFLNNYHALYYKFEEQNVINLSYDRSFNFQRFDHLLNTTAISINSIRKSTVANEVNFTTLDKVSIGWQNRNVSKARFYYINYFFAHTQNFMQSVLETRQDRLLIYSNQIFSHRVQHIFSLGGSKQFYLGSRLNRLDFSIHTHFNISKYPTLVESKQAELKVSSLRPLLEIKYVPRDYPIRELRIITEWNRDIFRLDELMVNKQNTLISTFTVEGGRKRMIWEANFEIARYMLEENQFTVPDVNLKYLYEVSDHLFLSVHGHDLLTLFKVTNFNSVTTTSDGNLVIQSFNDNNLSYLLLSATLKL